MAPFDKRFLGVLIIGAIGIVGSLAWSFHTQPEKCRDKSCPNGLSPTLINSKCLCLMEAK